MTIPHRLIFFREYKNWTTADLALHLGMPEKEYKDLETGKQKMDIVKAQRLSEIYQAPVEIFIIDNTPHYLQADVLFSNCTITGTSAAGYINHSYTDRGIEEIMRLRKEEVETLKAQIAYLQKENTRLIEHLGLKMENKQIGH